MIEKQKKMGRPKLPKDKSKKTIVTFRLIPEEKDRIERAAKAAGMRVSQWIRKTLLKAAGVDIM